VNALEPAVQWVTGSPLWSSTAPDLATTQRPALLRFESDQFMPELLKLLAQNPDELGSHVADARSYRRRPPGAPDSWTGDLTAVKLYQAAHGHFNLVAASLVCRMPGLPDRTLNEAGKEVVGFVLRRLVRSETSGSAEPATLLEAAWVDDPTEGKGWRTIAAAPNSAVPGEELLTMFPLTHSGASGRRRRVFVGLIPTSSADTFKASGALSPLVDEDPKGTKLDARKDAFATRVLAPLESLRNGAAATDPPISDTAEKARLRTAAAALRREASAFLLLDLAELVATYMPSAWTAVQAATPPSSGATRDLYQFLQDVSLGSVTLRAAVLDAWANRLAILDEGGPVPNYTIDLGTSTFSIDQLRAMYEAALPPPALDPASSPQDQGVGPEAEIPKLQPTPGTLFVVRPVLRRPCASPPVDVVGEPSERFMIASFFDPDAPARPIRVQLPIKTSIADLRKYPKNVGFVLSDQLREQMSRVTDLKRMMDGQLASGESFDVGLLCSFSMPIITIAALMALMIIIGLLNIVFWWAPFLKICLPIITPGKRA
jgi:hypothetical protein